MVFVCHVCQANDEETKHKEEKQTSKTTSSNSCGNNHKFYFTMEDFKHPTLVSLYKVGDFVSVDGHRLGYIRQLDVQTKSCTVFFEIDKTTVSS